ncbi:uncharacterized protein LOC122644717 [Telopea speciosissima]|uniref:uncharacterized protein LOC122644717 n=1 Tax=Telopea speciosissima TaxID=54955 RepID=UPI001CC46703|nr:uncharacterized protein LOC122644717 [Telopea speciosissima]
MVLSWILNVLSPDLAASVIYVESAHDVWKELEERFSRSNASRIFHLKRSIATIQQGTDTLSAYFTKLKVLWDELCSYIPVPTCSCGAQVALHSTVQQERVYQFLMGLSDSYAALRSNILAMDPLPDVNQAYHILLQDEQQRSLTLPSPVDTAAMAAGHTLNASSDRRSTNPGNPRQSRGRPWCDYCKSRTRRPSQGPNTGCDLAPKPAQVAAISTMPVNGLTTDQVQQLLSLLNIGSSSPSSNLAGTATCLSVSGPVNEAADWSGNDA